MNKNPNKNDKENMPSFRCIECNENEEKSFDLICVLQIKLLKDSLIFRKIAIMLLIPITKWRKESFLSI